MIFDIYVISFLFLIGFFVSVLDILIAIKLPKDDYEINICDHCENRYKWYELIPIFNYIRYLGKCRYCNKKLNLWYPIAQIFLCVIFPISYIIYGFSYEMIILIIISTLLVNIFISDFNYYIILDEPIILFSIMILILKFSFFGLKTFLLSLASGLIIFIFMLGIRTIGNKLSKQDTLGGGDIKLSFLFGCALGIRLSMVSIILGSFLAFPISLYYSLSSKNKHIPFGPYLITGLFIVFTFMDPIRDFLTIIFKGMY